MIRNLNISMSAASVNALKTQNYALYAFQAVRYGPQLRPSLMSAGYGGGYPLVWYRSTAYMANTPIEWDDSPRAYISSTPLGDNVQVAVGESQPVELGQIIEAGDGSLRPPSQNGNPGVVSIIGTGPDSLSCGLATARGAASVPICAFPLRPGEMAMIAPTPQMLVMFALDQPKAGMAITTAYGAGLLVDFNTDAERSVGFDIQSGWSAGGAIWSRKVSAGAKLAPLLILPANPP